MIDQLSILCIKVIRLLQAERLNAAGMSLQNPAKVNIISIEDSGSAHPKQPAFAFHVIIEGRVLPRPDMICGDIREDTDIKLDSLDSVKHQRL